MSITYSFHIATTRTVERLRNLLGVSSDGALSHAYGAGHPAHVLVKAIPPDPVGDTFVQSAYGFTPRVAVTVELTKYAEDEETRERPAVAVLRRLTDGLVDDMYGSYLGDYPVLVKRHGDLTIDRRWLRSRPWLRDALGTAYHIGDLVDPYSDPG